MNWPKLAISWNQQMMYWEVFWVHTVWKMEGNENVVFQLRKISGIFAWVQLVRYCSQPRKCYRHSLRLYRCSRYNSNQLSISSLAHPYPWEWFHLFGLLPGVAPKGYRNSYAMLPLRYDAPGMRRNHNHYQYQIISPNSSIHRLPIHVTDLDNGSIWRTLCWYKQRTERYRNAWRMSRMSRSKQVN